MIREGRFQSGQMGRAVNPLAQAFEGSNPPLPNWDAGVAQLARAKAFQALGRGFESRLPLLCALVAQLAERILGKDEVISSTLIEGFDLVAA